HLPPKTRPLPRSLDSVLTLPTGIPRPQPRTRVGNAGQLDPTKLPQIAEGTHTISDKGSVHRYFNFHTQQNEYIVQDNRLHMNQQYVVDPKGQVWKTQFDRQGCLYQESILEKPSDAEIQRVQALLTESQTIPADPPTALEQAIAYNRAQIQANGF